MNSDYSLRLESELELELEAKLEAELNARINPEKSRHFDPVRLLASRKTLEKILAQDCFRFREMEIGTRIGIIGSNGKGSTAFYLASLSKLKKEKVGLFTSPHLLCVRERVRLRTQASPMPQVISARLAWESLGELRRLLGQDYAALSYFEILTVLAAYVFRKEHCTLEIFEAGLGGRFDATRALKASHTILTIIEKEHTQILGAKPKDILREKLAILHQNSRCLFCMPQSQVSQEDIVSTAKEFAPQIEIFFYEQEKEEKEETEGPGHRKKRKKESEALPGARQTYLQRNKNFACFVLENLGLPYQKDSEVEIPGRLEKRSLSLPDGQTKELIFDVAHNPPAILGSLRDLSRQAGVDYPQRSLVLLALLKERPLKPCLAAVQQAGFFKIRQLVAENWAQAEPGLVSLDARDLCGALRDELSHSNLDRVIFLGTHYSYSHFIEMLK